MTRTEVPQQHSAGEPQAPRPYRRKLWLFALLAAALCAFALWLAPRWLPKPPLGTQLPFSRLIVDTQGAILRFGLSTDEKYRLPVRLEEISQHMAAASIFYEDRHFYTHPGINPVSLLRAFFSTYLEGGRRIGGSTISMQVARLQGGYSSSSLRGKLVQMFTALRLEAHYSKKEILEAYLQLAPYGYNIEGVEAAARLYFHKSAAQLTLGESLMLAVVPQNPGKRLPSGDAQQQAALHEAKTRLQSTYLEHTLNAEESTMGLSLPIQVYGPQQLPFKAPHHSQFLLASHPGRTQLVSTLDMRVQSLFEGIIARYAQRGSAYGLHNAAAMLVHWPTMQVKAHIGSADFYNAAIEGQIDGTRVPRSPGSTLKPFIYALAAQAGLIHPMSLLSDSPRSFAGYSPENFDQNFRGPIAAHLALKTSRNIPAISLAMRLKHPSLYDFLQNSGAALPYPEEHYGLSLVLGGAEMSMTHLAALYAALANQGLFRPLEFTVNAHSSPAAPLRLLSPEAALLSLDMLSDKLYTLPSGRGRLPLYLKTGTSNGFRDAWTIGIVGPYVLAVWAGNFNNSANPHLVGARVALPLFEDMARGLTHLYPLKDHILEQHKGLNLTRVPVCTATGDTDTSLCPDVTETWFIPGVSPIVESGVFRSILVDAATGLRACTKSGQNQRTVWEFWPSDLQRIFAQAGIVKAPPPAWMPGCEESGLNMRSGAPQITSPKEGLSYQIQLSKPEQYALSLAAIADADAKRLYWFSNTRYIGSCEAGGQLTWVPPAGQSSLRVVDDLGRSHTMRLVVEAVQ